MNKINKNDDNWKDLFDEPEIYCKREQIKICIAHLLSNNVKKLNLH